MISSRHVDLATAWKTPQFWLIWGVLCLNVSAGIGILGMASPLLQEIFAGKLLGVDLAFNDLSTEQKAQVATIAAGFTGLLSLFNIGGRFFGLHAPITWDEKRHTLFSSYSVSLCMLRFLVLVKLVISHCLFFLSALFCQCMAAVSRQFQPTWQICLVRKWWVPSTGAY